MKSTGRRRAASILEFTIAIVILGVIAALAIPKLSRADSPRSDGELRARLQVLRTAIELYHRDHGGYPGQPAAGAAAAEAALVRDLRPYLRQGIPASPLRSGRGPGRVHAVAGAVHAAIETVDADWIYNVDTGEIFANSPQVDGRGERFDQY